LNAFEVQQGEIQRLLIGSLQPVPWSESLKPQYNEAENKKVIFLK